MLYIPEYRPFHPVEQNTLNNNMQRWQIQAVADMVGTRPDVIEKQARLTIPSMFPERAGDNPILYDFDGDRVFKVYDHGEVPAPKPGWWTTQTRYVLLMSGLSSTFGYNTLEECSAKIAELKAWGKRIKEAVANA